MKLKQLFLCLLALLVSTMTRAYDFSVNGLYYNITGTNTVEVTYVENGEGNGDFYYDAITIPKRVSNNNTTYNVTRIGDDAFVQCYNLTSITIPESVTSIGNRAFYYCFGLKSVTIPNNVTSIGEYAFAYCNRLTSITIPNSVTSIGDLAFNGCSGLTSIIVEAGNTKYDSRGGCNALIETNSNTLIIGCKNTIIPYGVTSIGDYAFFSCHGLTSITIHNSVTSIGKQAFFGCNDLTSITIPSSVTSIENAAFAGCSGLTSIIVEAGNTKYDSRGGCNALIETSSNKLIVGCNNTIIPYGVTSIEESAFWKCQGLTSITIPNSVTSIGKSAFCLTGLTSITIPSSITNIGDNSFYAIRGLTYINIPSSVTSIGNWAFFDCNHLKTVLIPSSVTSIGESAFSNTTLTSVTAMSSDPVSIADFTFGSDENLINSSATLYVPAGSKAKYQAAAGWNKFPTITEFSVTNHLDAVKIPTTAGSKVRLPISLTDEGNTVGVQFDLLLPQGFTIPTVDSEGHVNITMGDRSNGHSASGRKVADGHYSFAIANMQNRALKGTEGTVAYIEINVDQNVEIADYDILITDAKLSVKSGTNQTGIVLANTPATLTVTDVTPGDVNGDGDIDIVDVTSTIGHVIHQTPSDFILKAADVNNDGDVDIVDVTTIIDMIINKGRNVKEFRNRVESLDPQ